jgi:hypothetical protein
MQHHYCEQVPPLNLRMFHVHETLEKQQEKESEVQRLQQRYEQDMKIMREDMEKKFQQLFSRIDMAKIT